MIISFEGMDGSGKTTQLELFQQLTGAVAIPQFSSLPKIGPRIKRAQMFMKVETARMDLGRLITPPDALVRIEDAKVFGKSMHTVHPYDLVLLDRSIDTTYAYSALFFKNADREEFLEYQNAISGWHSTTPKPDLTFYFDVKPAVAEFRLRARAGNDKEFDGMMPEQWMSTAERYSDLVAVDNKRIVTIDANGSVHLTHELVMNAYNDFLSRLLQ